MKPLNIELRDLRYFVAVADHQHFTQAAAALRIAQPSLSQQIRKLERGLGVELFYRTKRVVRLTPAGRAVLAEARSLLSQAEVTTDVARLAASGEMGELTIGFIESVVLTELPRLISAFQESHPRVTLKLIEMSTADQIAALRTRAIDVGLIRTPIQGDDIQTELLFKEPLAVALPRRHKLARRSSIPLRALRDEPLILYAGPRAKRLRDEIMTLCHQAGFMPAVKQEAAEFHTICGLVAAGLGVSFVPMSARAINIKGVVYRKLTAPSVDIDYCVAWLRSARSPAIRSFCSIISA
ncbi:MAG: LysR family transcriptional regulator [Vulcanimicrobiaceae bacterium]